MVIDTSAIIAILLGELEAPQIIKALQNESGGNLFISAATLLECRIVIFAKRKEEGIKQLELLIQTAAIAVEGFHEHLIAIAYEGFTRFGKGKHKANLNFGDCFTYALAKHRKDRILCKGNDFIHTDVGVVIY